MVGKSKGDVMLDGLYVLETVVYSRVKIQMSGSGSQSEEMNDPSQAILVVSLLKCENWKENKTEFE